MELFLAILSVSVGFTLLVKGADWLVDGASALARHFHISELIIGLTIVSLGTSMPELVVSLIASVRGEAEMVFGNIIGSNIMNTLLVLGVSGLVAKGGLAFSRKTVKREIPFSLVAGVLLFFLANDFLLDGGLSMPDVQGDWISGLLNRIDGIMLLTFFFMFLAYLASVAKAERSDKNLHAEMAEDFHHEMSVPKGAWLMLIGMVGLAVGGEFTIRGAVSVAEIFGVSDKMIGLLLLAGGTSLPELVTSVVAVKKGRSDIAIGNVLGSNIANIFLVLGATSVLVPLSFPYALNPDLGVVVLSSLLLLVFMFVSERYNRLEKNPLGKVSLRLSTKEFRFERPEAAVFILGYLAYVVFLFIRS
jgi:cation:H+ antiporter